MNVVQSGEGEGMASRFFMVLCDGREPADVLSVPDRVHAQCCGPQHWCQWRIRVPRAAIIWLTDDLVHTTAS